MKINKKLIGISALTFALGIAMSWFLEMGATTGEGLQATADATHWAALSQDRIFRRVLQNNLVVICINFVGGFSFGILNFLNTLYNGLVLGYFVKHSLESFSTEFLFWSIAPHSIEFIGIILSCYVGFMIAGVLYRLTFRNVGPTSAEIKSILGMVFICFLIIVTAAYLEAYVTLAQ